MEKCKGGVRCHHDPMCKAPREQFDPIKNEQFKSKCRDTMRKADEVIAKFNPHSPDCKLSITEKAQYAGADATYKPDYPQLEVDLVNHPPHYTQYEGFEVIDITKQMDFLTGNALKYILRAPFKGTTKQDYEKAIWYLNKKLEEME